MHQALREVIEQRIEQQWPAWSKEHPNLARVIDRTRLVEVTVQRLRDEPAFIEAMRRADLDEQKLIEAGRVLAIAERVVGRVLRF
jgi:hypothetical protein